MISFSFTPAALRFAFILLRKSINVTFAPLSSRNRSQTKAEDFIPVQVSFCNARSSYPGRLEIRMSQGIFHGII